MCRLSKILSQFSLCWLFVAVAAAQTAQLVEAPKTVNDYYQSALQSYLTGDFDEAILWDSKALQVDPQDKKASALLSILVSEKDTANKTVIWIGGKPSVVENVPANPVSQVPVTIFKDRGSRPAAVDSKKMQELETRVQTVAFLMERDSFNQYRELSGAQAETTKRLDEISFDLKGVGSGTKVSNFLFFLALVLAGIALWKSWKNGEEIRKQKESFIHSASAEEKGRVIKIHRM